MSETKTENNIISDDYQVTQEILRSDVELPFILVRLAFMLIAILANIGLVYYLLANRYNLIGILEFEVAVAVVTGLSIFVLGLIGGKLWISIGYRLSRATYDVYLQRDKGLLQRIFSFLYLRFSEPDNHIYLEARAKDPRLNNPFNLLQLVINISISQLSFFMVGTAFLARPLVSLLRDLLPRDNILIISQSNQLIVQNIGAMAIAVTIMGFYIPMNYIMTDSNIRTWSTKEMKIGTPSQKLRSRIDSFVGLGAIISGWGIYMAETQGGQDRFLLVDISWIVQGYDLAMGLDYVLWLGALLILAWPLIIPASIYYFQNHGKTVNKFRAEASARGVPIGISKVRLPEPAEEDLIREFENTLLNQRKNTETSDNQ